MYSFLRLRCSCYDDSLDRSPRVACNRHHFRVLLLPRIIHSRSEPIALYFWVLRFHNFSMSSQLAFNGNAHRSSTVGNLQVRSRRSVVNAGRTSIGVGAPRAMKNKAGSKSRGGVGSRGASRPRLSLSPPRTKLSSHGMAIAAAAQRGTAVSSASGQVSAASGGAATGSATGNAVPKRNPLIRGSSPPRPPRVSMSRSAAAQAGAAKTSAKRAAVLARRTEGRLAEARPAGIPLFFYCGALRVSLVKNT